MQNYLMSRVKQSLKLAAYLLVKNMQVWVTVPDCELSLTVVGSPTLKQCGLFSIPKALVRWKQKPAQPLPQLA